MTSGNTEAALQTAPPPRVAESMTDLEAIHNLVARFDDAVNRRDKGEFGKLWAQDAVWEIGDPRPLHVEGADEIVSTWSKMLFGSEWMFRGSFAGVVTVDGAAGAGRWPCIETGTLILPDATSPQGYDNRAVYEDIYVKKDGTWLFSRRRYLYLWLSTDTLPGRPVKLGAELK